LVVPRRMATQYQKVLLNFVIRKASLGVIKKFF